MSATRLLKLTLLSCAAANLWAQDPPQPNEPVEAERWNLFYQATSIGQYHGTFNSPYEGPYSLQDYPERDASLTTTLFFTLRLQKNTLFVFNPEIAGGRGFSGMNGLANSPNGELPRVATATPKPYLARLYVTQDFGFGDRAGSCRKRREPTRRQPPRQALFHYRSAASPSPIFSTTTATPTIRAPSSWAGP